MAGKRRPRRRATGLSPEQTQVEARLRETLPAVVQREREAAGLTQEQLAEKAGLHFTTVGKIERGKQIPSLALLSVLSRALDLTLAEFLEKALPEAAADAAADEDDPTVRFIKGLPKRERQDLLPVLQALKRWKDGA